MNNQFEKFLIEEYSDAADLTDYEVSRITSDNRETVELLTVEYAPGKVAAGYRVYWANGRMSYRLPNPGNGHFLSSKDAMLYTLGFMSCYLQWFLPETVAEIKTKIAELTTNNLF
jgi:hypothetical protein